MDTQTLQQATEHLGATVPDRRERQTAVRAAENEWAEWLRSEYAPDLNAAQGALLYARAWEDGHAYGYREVENHYSELADLLTNILAAG